MRNRSDCCPDAQAVSLPLQVPTRVYSYSCVQLRNQRKLQSSAGDRQENTYAHSLPCAWQMVQFCPYVLNEYLESKSTEYCCDKSRLLVPSLHIETLYHAHREDLTTLCCSTNFTVFVLTPQSSLCHYVREVPCQATQGKGTPTSWKGKREDARFSQQGRLLIC